MNYGLFLIIYQFSDSIGRQTGWGESEFFIFLGTIWIINSLIQTFFMANATEFSEMIRTGNLDFALLKPIDTQFLISFPRVNWAQLANAFLGLAVIVFYLQSKAVIVSRAKLAPRRVAFAWVASCLANPQLASNRRSCQATGKMD